MSDANPYESPDTKTPQGSHAPHDENSQAAADDGKILRYAQLGLRLLGVMFIVDGIVGFVGSMTNGAMQSFALQRAGYPPVPDSYVFGWAAQSVGFIVIGIYCVVGGRWVLETVFLPASRTPEIDRDDSESSDE